MRVLILVRSLKIGGMERVAVNLADSLVEAGHECHLRYFKTRATELRPSHSGVQLQHFNLERAVRLTGLGLVLEMLSRLCLNVVWRKSHFVWIGWIGGAVLRLHIAGIERKQGRFDRIVFRGQGTFEDVWSFRDNRVVYVLENILHDRGLNWRDRVAAQLLFDGRHLVGVSQGVVKSVRDSARRLRFQPQSVRAITNPCPVERIRRAMLEREPDLPQEEYLLNVARLVDQKDHPLLLRAYAEARLEQRLVIVGDGPRRARLEALARELGIQDRVLFAGERVNPYPWMHRARLLVLSSKFEGLGIVLLEALACGTPLVSVDCPGGVRDILSGELESCLAPHSVSGLAAKLREVLARPRQPVKLEWLEPFKPALVAQAFLADAVVASRSPVHASPS